MKRIVIALLCLLTGCGVPESSTEVSHIYVQPTGEELWTGKAGGPHTNLPPGYVLQCNAQGDWRAATDDEYRIVCIDPLAGPMTRQRAIERAWAQYQFKMLMREPPQEGWSECE